MSQTDTDTGSEDSSSGGFPTGSPQVNRRRLTCKTRGPMRTSWLRTTR